MMHIHILSQRIQYFVLRVGMKIRLGTCASTVLQPWLRICILRRNSEIDPAFTRHITYSNWVHVHKLVRASSSNFCTSKDGHSRPNFRRHPPRSIHKYHQPTRKLLPKILPLPRTLLAPAFLGSRRCLTTQENTI